MKFTYLGHYIKIPSLSHCFLLVDYILLKGKLRNFKGNSYKYNETTEWIACEQALCLGKGWKKSRGEGRGRVTPSLSSRYFALSPNREPVRSYWMKKDRTWLSKQIHQNNSRLFANGVALLQSVFTLQL